MASVQFVQGDRVSSENAILVGRTGIIEEILCNKVYKIRIEELQPFDKGNPIIYMSSFELFLYQG